MSKRYVGGAGMVKANIGPLIFVAIALIPTRQSAAQSSMMRPEDRAALEAEMARDAAEGRPKSLPPSLPTTAPNWEAAIDAYFEAHLKDPYSAVKRVVRGPRFGTVRVDFWTTWTGWAVCMSVNAKNAYGAYVGARPYLLVIDTDGKVNAVENSDDSLWYGAVLRQECSQPADPDPVARP